MPNFVPVNFQRKPDGSVWLQDVGYPTHTKVTPAFVDDVTCRVDQKTNRVHFSAANASASYRILGKDWQGNYLLEKV
jgi:hypothetical protein